jgi:RNA polymerase sigma-70 factor (ECF subfamily)
LQNNSYISDEKLVNAIRKDDHFAFDALFRKYGPPLFAFVLSVLKEKYWAEEAVQEVFFKIWEKRKDLDPSLSFKSYLFTIALNTTKKHYRKKLQEEKYKQDVALELHTDHTSDFDVVEYRNLLEYVDKIIDKLPPSRREIFIMSKKDGLKNSEIAKCLNISEQTVKNQLVSAMKFFRSEAVKSDKELGFFFFLFFYRL